MENLGGIQVSVLCLAYNHEKYIRDCLEGFVMQKGITFEVIIHDDASEDGTADIIREYEKKYPEIIKPVYQRENQYSQDVDIFSKFLMPNARGKYLAFCEGDDFWTDPGKLERQFDALEKNPGCCYCTHGVQVVDDTGASTGKVIPYTNIPDGLIRRSEFFSNILSCDHYPFQTSSYFVRTDECRKLCENLPEFVKAADVADMPFILYFSYLGGVYYIDEKMSCYRRSVKGSWSQRVQGKPENYIRHINHMKNVLRLFNEYTENSVNISPLRDVYVRNEFWAYNELGDYKKALKLLRKEKIRCSKKVKTVTFFNAYFPRAYPAYCKIKSAVKRQK